MAPVADTDFRDPLRIPGHKKGIYVYRHADAHIPATHIRRFGEIVDILKDNLLKDKHLARPRLAATMYKLKMCGVNEQEAQPSILICHPLLDKGIGRRIQKGFCSSNLREQYEWTSDNTCPGFKIYLYLSAEFQFLGNPMNLLSIHTCRDSEVAQIVSTDDSHPISTITCGVIFPGHSTVFAIISAHAFEGNGDEKIGELAWSHDDSTFDSPSPGNDDISNEGSSRVGDDYDWDELEAAAAEERQGGFSSDLQNSSPLAIRDEKHISCSEIKLGKVFGRPNDPKWSSQPDLNFY
jgi:hypothetical protein